MKKTPVLGFWDWVDFGIGAGRSNALALLAVGRRFSIPRQTPTLCRFPRN